MIVRAGLRYTVVRAAMLLPRPKTGTAPALLQGAAAAKRGVISRDTLAAVCMAALRTPAVGCLAVTRFLVAFVARRM